MRSGGGFSLGLGLGLGNSGRSGPAINFDFTQGALDSRITFTRASTATYVNSSGFIASASSGQARFGYDPVTLLPLGLLIEESRTNQQIHSDFVTRWTLEGAITTTGASTTFPDGNAGTYGVFASSTASGARDVNATDWCSGTASAPYAVSVYFKPKGNNGYIGLNAMNSGFSVIATAIAYFDLTAGTGVVGADALAGFTSKSVAITPAGNGFYRAIFFVTTPALTIYINTFFGPCTTVSGVGDNRAYTGVVGNGVYLYGPQVEAVSTNHAGPTSYIPTVLSTVTRAADTAAMTGTNFSSWYSQSAGTFVVTVTPPGDYNQAGIVLQAYQNAAGLHEIFKVNAAVSAAGKRWVGLTNVSGLQALLPTGSDGAAVTAKLAYAYAANDFAFVADTTLVGSDSSGTLPSPTELDIGYSTSSGQQFNGHIASVKYYNLRLSNTQLQALTA